jgi:uncharacterized protein (DUF305 family)
MKTLIKTISCILLVASVASCKKEETPAIVTPPTPSHESNSMMMEIHKMMNMMDTMDMSGDPDHHFAKMMKMHHMGAIDMSNIVIAHGTDTTIRRIAQNIIMKQNMEITDLTSFLNSHTPHGENMEFNMKMEKSMQKMHNNADLQSVNGNTDHDFASLIIFHHQSAIEMADFVIHYGHEVSIKNMAEMMIEDQEMEIEELQNWLLNN